MTHGREDATELYDRVATEASGRVIRGYSTSFGLASRLLPSGTHRDIANVYALVRIADEAVDGVAENASMAPAQILLRLDELEAETGAAIGSGYSTNLVVHAFALTARRAGFGTELTGPFFRSMRADLQRTEYTADAFEEYVYGSAEVVGLMCLRVFLAGRADAGERYELLASGARRLGAAFQKINFLRDLAADYGERGRSYFPMVNAGAFSETEKNAILDDIDEDLRQARIAISGLPPESRRAVLVAHRLFAELSARIRHTPCEDLLAARVRLPNPVKVRLAVGAILESVPAFPWVRP